MQLGRNLKEVMPVSTCIRCVGQEGQCRVDTLCSHQNKELGVARTKGEEVVYWLTFANLNDHTKLMVSDNRYLFSSVTYLLTIWLGSARQLVCKAQ